MKTASCVAILAIGILASVSAAQSPQQGVTGRRLLPPTGPVQVPVTVSNSNGVTREGTMFIPRSYLNGDQSKTNQSSIPNSNPGVTGRREVKPVVPPYAYREVPLTVYDNRGIPQTGTVFIQNKYLNGNQSGANQNADPIQHRIPAHRLR